MLLALDVGNTNITLGVYEREKLLFVTRMATNPPRMEDEYASAMLSILHLYNIHTSQVNGAVLSSVVPRLTGLPYSFLSSLEKSALAAPVALCQL